MSPSILIVTHPKDFHAHVVAHVLRRKGAAPVLWLTSDFPTQATETVSFIGSGEEIEIRDVDDRVVTTAVERVWLRRSREELGPANLHPADQSFAAAQCRRFRASLLGILSDRIMAAGGLCVNPYSSFQLAESKLWQHHLAARAGLDMPKSVYTNDPGKIRRFLEERGGRIVFKPFSGETWSDGEKCFGYYTNAIAAEDLVDDDLLQAVPGIYQELVPKAYELRVTVFGGRAFAGKINSQQTKRGQLDWRRSYEDLTIEPCELPEAVLEPCLELMRRLGIVFGCFDFIVTPEGRHVFLEVNPAGQFLFVEQYSGLPIVDAFCEFLIQGRAGFEWRESASTIRLRDIWDDAAADFNPRDEKHVDTNIPVVDETRFAPAGNA
jgi:hypothetical protein